jgi:hypothetical protein
MAWAQLEGNDLRGYGYIEEDELISPDPVRAPSQDPSESPNADEQRVAGLTLIPNHSHRFVRLSERHISGGLREYCGPATGFL